jgi:hypothetical protein
MAPAATATQARASATEGLLSTWEWYVLEKPAVRPQVTFTHAGRGDSYLLLCWSDGAVVPFLRAASVWRLFNRSRAGNTPKDLPSWVGALCRIPDESRQGGSILQHFRRARPDLRNEALAVALIRLYLLKTPALIAAWQQYSWDKRTSGPYLEGCEVGFVPRRGPTQVHGRYEQPVDACAEFIFLEAVAVLRPAYW